eukprot:300045-Rhodomonas_salina.4
MSGTNLRSATTSGTRSCRTCSTLLRPSPSPMPPASTEIGYAATYAMRGTETSCAPSEAAYDTAVGYAASTDIGYGVSTAIGYAATLSTAHCCQCPYSAFLRWAMLLPMRYAVLKWAMLLPVRYAVLR